MVPSTVEEKLMFAPAVAPLVLFNVTLFIKEAIPVIPIVPPLVVMFPPRLIAVVLALVLVAEKFPRAVVPPTAPESVIVPDPDVRVRACDPAAVPSIVPPKEITPLSALVLIVAVPTNVNTVGTAFVIVNPFAVTLPPIETADVPAAEETVTTPRLVAAPRAPPNVIAPAVPAFTVSA